MNKLYLITTNNKKFDEWAKQNKKRLKDYTLDHFNAGYNDVVKGNYLARASFVCYWEIYNNNSLAKVAPAMTQASLIHMMHRFMERGQQDEVIVTQQLMSNFLRLLQALNQEPDKGESNEEE
jgi:arginine/lysine/ornithine decarboxylase